MSRHARWLAGVLGLAVAATAGAAQQQQPERRKETNVFLKGGVGGYTGNVGDYSSTGPTWGLTVNLQPLNILGFEVGYEGSRNETPLGERAFLRNGASGLVKIAPPFIERVKPFVGAGIGLSYVSVSGGQTGQYRNDFMEEVPVVAGIEFNTRAVTAGVRATYRFLLDSGFTPAGSEGGLFDATLTLGGRF